MRTKVVIPRHFKIVFRPKVVHENDKNEKSNWGTDFSYGRYTNKLYEQVFNILTFS